jgi:excisionase family DNA binding protein
MEKLLTAQEVADLLGVPIRSLYDWGPKRRPPAARVGKHLRFRAADVERWVDDRMAGRS